MKLPAFVHKEVEGRQPGSWLSRYSLTPVSKAFDDEAVTLGLASPITFIASSELVENCSA